MATNYSLTPRIGGPSAADTEVRTPKAFGVCPGPEKPLKRFCGNLRSRATPLKRGVNERTNRSENDDTRFTPQGVVLRPVHTVVASLLLLLLLTWQSAVAASERGVPPAKHRPELSPLWDVAGGTNAPTKRQWDRKRKELKRQWMEFLGPFPKRIPPLKTEVMSTEETADFRRQHIRYQAEKGLYVDGYLLTPRNIAGKLPAVVVFHPTTPFGARGVAGLEPSYPREKWQAVDLVRRGYVVWCPRNYINTEGADYAGNAAALLARHPDWTGMTRMTWDAIRAADFLESRLEVDRKRIACLGHSLGGKEVLYAMAFDERYCAGISSEGGIGLDFSNWDARWYLGPRIRQPGFPLEHHQLLALIAPRPFLLLAGDSADDERSLAFLDAVRPIYALLGGASNLEWFDHHQGHNYGPPAQAEVEEFLNRRLSSGSKP